MAIRDVAPLAGVTQQVNESLTDVEVVARVLGGDGEAFGILIRRYEPGLLRFAARMLGAVCAPSPTAIKELIDELDPEQFWQIHRSTLVNPKAIAGVSRDMRGRQLVSVKGHNEKLEVSRSFTGLFKGLRTRPAER